MTYGMHVRNVDGETQFDGDNELWFTDGVENTIDFPGLNSLEPSQFAWIMPDNHHSTEVNNIMHWPEYDGSAQVYGTRWMPAIKVSSTPWRLLGYGTYYVEYVDDDSTPITGYFKALNPCGQDLDDAIDIPYIVCFTGPLTGMEDEVDYGIKVFPNNDSNTLMFSSAVQSATIVTKSVFANPLTTTFGNFTQEDVTVEDADNNYFMLFGTGAANNTYYEYRLLMEKINSTTVRVKPYNVFTWGESSPFSVSFRSINVTLIEIKKEL